MTPEKFSNTSTFKGAIDIYSLACPVCFTFLTCGTIGYFGQISILQMILLLLFSICVASCNSLAYQLGVRIKAQDQKADYYEKKFAHFKATKRSFDPLASTAGDPWIMRLAAYLAAASALSLILGVAFCLSCFGLMSSSQSTGISNSWLGVAIVVIILALVILRYIGRWHYGARPYGTLIVFALGTGGSIAIFWMLIGQWIAACAFSSMATGLMCAIFANLDDLKNMSQDSALEYSTLPIAIGADRAKIIHIALGVLMCLWLLAYPTMLNSISLSNYAFAVFFIPLIINLLAIRGISPSKIDSFMGSFGISAILLSIAFFLSVSWSNLTALVAFVAN